MFFASAPERAELEHDRLGEHVGRDVVLGAALGERLDLLGGAGEVAHPHARAHGLGEGRSVEDPARAVGREHRRRQLGVAEPDQPVGIVLEDPEAVLVRELDQPLALGGRERASGGVVEVGDHVGELHRAAGERRLEGVQVEPVRLQRHRHQLRARTAEQQQGAVVGGLLDDHAIAGLDHVAEEQRRGLHRAVGDHHLPGVDPVELGGDPLAEPGMADPGAVGERLLPVVGERSVRRLADGRGGQDVGARGASGEADHVGGHAATIAT